VSAESRFTGNFDIRKSSDCWSTNPRIQTSLKPQLQRLHPLRTPVRSFQGPVSLSRVKVTKSEEGRCRVMLRAVRSDDGGHRLVEAEQHSLALAAPSAAARARLCPATNGSVSVHSSQNIPFRCFAGASRRERSHGPNTPAESSPRAFQQKHFAKDFGVRSLPRQCPCLSSDHGSTAHRSCPGLGEDNGVRRLREMLPRSAGRSRRRSDSTSR
jgi:hypothetical protein